MVGGGNSYSFGTEHDFNGGSTDSEKGYSYRRHHTEAVSSSSTSYDKDDAMASIELKSNGKRTVVETIEDVTTEDVSNGEMKEEKEKNQKKKKPPMVGVAELVSSFKLHC